MSEVNQDKVMRKHMQERLGKVNYYELYPPLPQNLNIELNNTCNQKCVFCSFHGKYSKYKLSPAVMEIECAKKILLKAKELGIGKKKWAFIWRENHFVIPD